MLRIALIFILSLGLMACNKKKKEEDLSGPIRVQIPFMIDGKYSLQIIELLTMENLVELKGLAARFLIDPDTVSGKLQGRAPEIRYIRDEDGVIMAKDSLSLQLLTVYAHFEKMRDMDESLGLDKVIKWPATVAVNARYQSVDGALVNNALYSAHHDALLMVPFTGDALPIMANGGVLAHEHFHKIFQKLVVENVQKKMPALKQLNTHDLEKMSETMALTDDIQEETNENESARETYHKVLMRALNEGLADVWGWAYSGDSDFVGRSLPQEKMRREINVQANRIESMNEIKSWIESGMTSDSLMSLSYALGTQYARTVRGYAQMLADEKGLTSEEMRKQASVFVLRLLPDLAKKIESLSAEQFLAPGDVVEMMIGKADSLSASQCYYFAKLVPAGERKESTKELCQSLEKSEEIP